MEPVCQERICSEDQSVWDPQTCQCGNHEDTCDDGEQLYLDIFGQGVCGCKPGTKFFLVINKDLGFERLAYLFDLISEFLFC